MTFRRKKSERPRCRLSGPFFFEVLTPELAESELELTSAVRARVAQFKTTTLVPTFTRL